MVLDLVNTYRALFGNWNPTAACFSLNKGQQQDA